MPTTDSQSGDVWGRGAAYERYVGRWSRLVAHEFLAWLAAPPDSRWLDVGCGAGGLCQTILAVAAPRRITGVDSAPGFIEYARQQAQDPRVSFEVGDAQALPVESDAFDIAVAGLVLNFVPDPARGVAEMTRSVRPGGRVAAYVWDYAGEMQFMRTFWNVAVALDPQAAARSEGSRFALCQPDPLMALFLAAGLHAVEVRAIDAPTVFRDFDDYWSPFLGGQGPAPTYVMSLDEERRAALRECLRAALPIAEDGSIPLNARAWAVRGVKDRPDGEPDTPDYTPFAPL